MCSFMANIKKQRTAPSFVELGCSINQPLVLLCYLFAIQFFSQLYCTWGNDFSIATKNAIQVTEGLSTGHIYLSHSHSNLCLSRPIPWDFPFPWTSLGLSMGHIYLSHSHTIAIYACPIPWDVSHGQAWVIVLAFLAHENTAGTVIRLGKLTYLPVTYLHGKVTLRFKCTSKQIFQEKKHWHSGRNPWRGKVQLYFFNTFICFFHSGDRVSKLHWTRPETWFVWKSSTKTKVLFGIWPKLVVFYSKSKRMNQILIANNSTSALTGNIDSKIIVCRQVEGKERTGWLTRTF